MSDHLTLTFDGLCEPRNPGGWACWSWIAYADGQRVAEDAGCLGHGPGMTNNVAEYQAAIEALTWAHQHADGASIELCGDSLLVINQVRGQWKCNAEHLQPLRDRMVELVNETGARLKWIPREQNTGADTLCWSAYREASGAGGYPAGKTREQQERRTPVQLTDLPTLYWALARWAVGQGLITEDEAKLIARAGTRKQGYWARHLVDLCAVLSGSCSEGSTLRRPMSVRSNCFVQKNLA